MSDFSEAAARLRAANPVPGVPRADPPRDVLSRIVSTPRTSRQPRRSALVRRPVLAACIALLVACGIALAADISVRYFDESGAKPLPARVRSALQFAADHRSPSGPLAFADTVRAYVFTSDSGSGAVYMTPYIGVPGFCAALDVAGKPVQAGCVSTRGTIADVAGEYGQPWDVQLAPDTHALLGRLAPSAASDTVEIEFEDGAKDDVPMHERWFAYAVAGKRTQAGHRPVQLTFLRDGRVVRRRALRPLSFNTLAAARALVPAGDGSRGQEAVRRYLLDGLSGQLADGGDIASHTDLARTALVASLGFGDGRRLSFYTAPVRRLTGWPAGGSILLGLVDGSDRPVFSGLASVSPAGTAFRPPAGCRCSIPGHHDDAFILFYESIPTGVTRVAIRTLDGHEHAAGTSGKGRQWIWVGLDKPSARPIALIGRDADGRVVTTRRLRGAAGFGR